MYFSHVVTLNALSLLNCGFQCDLTEVPVKSEKSLGKFHESDLRPKSGQSKFPLRFSEEIAEVDLYFHQSMSQSHLP